ncbi:hypothetical protein ES703_11792 [subsurface metagenome]
MKRFLKKRFLGIPLIAILIVVLVGTVALAAWGITELTFTGSITTVSPPPPTQTYTVDTTELAFGDTTVVRGGAVNVTSSAITITNTGEAAIEGIDVVITNDAPLTLKATPNVIGDFPLATGGTAEVTVTITGTAGPLPNFKYALHAMTATLTPN